MSVLNTNRNVEFLFNPGLTRILKNHGVDTVDIMACFRKQDLLKWKGIGVTNIIRMSYVLKRFGLSFLEDTPAKDPVIIEEKVKPKKRGSGKSSLVDLQEIVFTLGDHLMRVEKKINKLLEHEGIIFKK